MPAVFSAIQELTDQAKHLALQQSCMPTELYTLYVRQVTKAGY